MKIKTSEFSGSSLDWAVAVAVGAHCQETGSSDLRTGKHWVVSGFRSMRWDDWSPSTDWSQGGPLIERFLVTVTGSDCEADEGEDWRWSAAINDHPNSPAEHWEQGHSPLIAACRAIVAAKLGDEVDVPEGLV